MFKDNIFGYNNQFYYNLDWNGYNHWCLIFDNIKRTMNKQSSLTGEMSSLVND